jgi:hypothetical protein
MRLSRSLPQVFRNIQCASAFLAPRRDAGTIDRWSLSSQPRLELGAYMRLIHGMILGAQLDIKSG